VSAPRPKPGVVAEDVPGTGESVLLDPARGRVLALNPTAAAVWDLLDGRRDAAELARVVAAASGAEPARVQTDVDDLLARLGDEGFLQASS